MYDFVIIGSGFGGSACALRLVEKGHDVLMLEKGREWRTSDFARTNWNLRRWLWAPIFGFRGPYQIRFFRHVTVLAGAGVGGGSLVYANTLPIPQRSFFEAAGWSHLARWEEELGPHYETARRMLGAVENPRLMPADELLRELARERGLEDGFRPTQVSVFFGEPGRTVQDPYFGGEGPERAGCVFCGGCMTGCRHNAKNTLDKNYLYLARKRGLHLLADTEATWVRPHPDGTYEISAREGASLWFSRRRQFRARNVIFAGGVLGTLSLLLKLRAAEDGLPRLSPRLGHRVRTNSESLIAVTNGRRDVDHSRGVAIGSILETDPHSHLEPVRHASGNGFFRTLLVPHVPGAAPGPVKLAQALLTSFFHPVRTLRTALVWNWAKHTIFLLYMRTLEGTLQLRRKSRGWARLNGSMATSVEQGDPPQASIPEASELAAQWAERQRSIPFSGFTETLFNIPSTAHILGGCCMGDSAETGVIDARHRVFGYDGLWVVDGSAISANPGVNPALTILALAERAMSFIPPKS